jgi:C4-type Zn-finger protein
LLLDPNGHSQILHESATSTELSEEEIAALATGPQIPIFDSSDFEE